MGRTPQCERLFAHYTDGDNEQREGNGVAAIKRLPELGQIVYRDPGRFPAKQLLIWGSVGLVGAAIGCWVGAPTSQGRGDPTKTLLIVAIGTVVFFCAAAIAVWWRAFVVCEHGLVRYIRCFGAYYGNFVIIDFPQLVAPTVQAVADAKQVSQAYKGSSSFNEGASGSAVAFLARNRETAAAMSGARLAKRGRLRVLQETIADIQASGRSPDPRIGVACWVHSSSDPDRLAYAILSAMARDGFPEAAARLSHPMSYHDPAWELYRR